MWAGFSSHTTPIHRCIDALIHVCNDADMSRVISVVNTKGGVGKTTTAVYLATALSCQDRVVFPTPPLVLTTEITRDISASLHTCISASIHLCIGVV